ncbi:hypothetical protein ISS42_02415 [Candidatus Shapirobacteria bacterium]|nr:hypothetical protein [Candidatus Shapirobacteria bacterium]
MIAKMLQLIRNMGKLFSCKKDQKGLKDDLARSGKLGGKLIIMQATSTLI